MMTIPEGTMRVSEWVGAIPKLLTAPRPSNGSSVTCFLQAMADTAMTTRRSKARTERLSPTLI
jgi:ABC-type uncharacterized transport system YnjBCD substrate-binding protein